MKRKQYEICNVFTVGSLFKNFQTSNNQLEKKLRFRKNSSNFVEFYAKLCK